MTQTHSSAVQVLDLPSAIRSAGATLAEALDRLEAEVPRVAEQVCSGSARMRDFPYIRGAYRVGEAVVSWCCTYPDLVAEWDALGRRTLAVMRTLTALDPAGGWSPPMPADEHPG